MMKIKPPYLLCLGSATEQSLPKTAIGINHWRPENCIGQISLTGCTVDLGIPELTLQEAVDRGAKTLILGVAPAGGKLPSEWHSFLLDALNAGLDIASGLHQKLRDIPAVLQKAKGLGRKLHDIRYPNSEFPTGSGENRSGKRLLTVGTDCAVGKMYTALAIEKEMHTRGLNVDFRATGQTGIFIAGDGIPIDAVVCDFTSGAAEAVSPSNSGDHWDIVEGQGSLFHPSFAGVTLGLIHGSQPDALVLCHEVGRTHIKGVEGYPLPTYEQCFDAYLKAAHLTNSEAKFVGIALNTSRLNEEEATAYMEGLKAKTGLPVVDPVRTGVSEIVDEMEHA